MLCSNCSEEIRPIVAVDIDGTLADYHDHFLGFAANWIARNHSYTSGSATYDGSYPFSKWCMDFFSIDLATYRQIKLAYRQGGMKRTMPIFDSAWSLCHLIHAAG